VIKNGVFVEPWTTRMPLERFFDLQRQRQRQQRVASTEAAGFVVGIGSSDGVDITDSVGVGVTEGACCSDSVRVDLSKSSGGIGITGGVGACVTEAVGGDCVGPNACAVSIGTDGETANDNIETNRLPNDAVYYLSHQNSNLTEEMDTLLRCVSDIESCLSFARDAFGVPPDATNLWLGPDDAVTSLHKVSFYYFHIFFCCSINVVFLSFFLARCVNSPTGPPGTQGHTGKFWLRGVSNTTESNHPSSQLAKFK
jgi:hypothetical protein